jgi:ATP-dependent protease HslVU (ClpYQ) peptidase subunit
MTCIVGIVESGQVWIGGDSVGSDGWVNVSRSDPKVFHNGDFLIGFTSSFRMGQLLRYSFTPPVIGEDQDVFGYMVTSFVNSMRECFKAGGFARKESEEEKGGQFLVGYRGRLFEICSDYQVGEIADGYDAVGCGYQVALGSLYSTCGAMSADRVRIALEAAEKFCGMVRSPFVVESLSTP